MILVCHAADGHFADGDREAVRAMLAPSACVSSVNILGSGRYQILCADGGQLELHAPGLEGAHAFHHMELFLQSKAFTHKTLSLILTMMQQGGFGLMDGLDAPQFIVTSPQQVHYFPRLPNTPLLVRSPRDLGRVLH
jgi:hypothetical protein